MKNAMTNNGGKLVICPTPIGNLGDVTCRMREALENAQVVCAEDTRVTGKLLAALGIKRPLERLDEATLAARAASVVERVLAGEVIVYCSDAGMPGISDPGLRLVRAAREAGAPVEVLPGPVAAATAYVASGCVNQRFFFAGFFPRKDADRRAALQSVAMLDAALIYYESPKRLVDALAVIAQVFPYREMAVCRELTKLHEEVVRGNTAYVRDVFSQRAEVEGIKGEIALVIDGPSPEEEAAAARETATDAQTLAAQLRAEGVSKKDIAKKLAAELGISRNEAYEIALGGGAANGARAVNSEAAVGDKAADDVTKDIAGGIAGGITAGSEGAAGGVATGVCADGGTVAGGE